MTKDILVDFLFFLFVLLARLGVFFSIRTDRKLPYAQARLKSIQKAFLFIALAIFPLMVSVHFVKPMNLETILFCIGSAFLVIGMSYGIAYLQIKVIKRNTEARKLFYPDKDDE